MHGDVLFDGRRALRDAAKTTAAQPLRRDIAEAALDYLEPKGRCGRKAHVKAPVLGKPRPDGGVLMGGVVVADKV